MFTKATNALFAIGLAGIALASASIFISGQQTVQPSSSSRTEFPVIMRQNVVAGKTPVGTKVQAELVIATMFNGVVVPRSAILSGEVTESVAKSKTEESRLSIRMESAQWKNGSAPVRAYLTAWYYPEAAATNQDVSYQPQDQVNSKRNWNGQGAYPDPNNPVSQERFPSGRDSGKDSGQGAATPASSISKHRIPMKNVQSARNADGTVTLSSDRMNLKIDKITTYVLADGDLLPN
jgi:hypothetical protein